MIKIKLHFDYFLIKIKLHFDYFLIKIKLNFDYKKITIRYNTNKQVEICRDNCCRDFKSACDLEARNKLWSARHNSWFAHKAFHPNRKAISTDVCVPIGRLSEVLVQAQKDMDELQIRGSLLGHVGDGNFHTFVSLDVGDASDMHRFDEYNRRLMRRSLAVGGTCTGEHGIAIGKHLLAVVCEPLANRSLIYA